MDACTIYTDMKSSSSIQYQSGNFGVIASSSSLLVLCISFILWLDLSKPLFSYSFESQNFTILNITLTQATQDVQITLEDKT